ncbi:hypothetical protein LDENG_00115830 [Lucifuga dentata]|nr:hypothetical protein LDENG_00115830 [Lucifuga dentata]
MELVLVEYEFEYTTRDGRLVSIKPNESYILVSKTNNHWWHVRKDQHTRPFYVPAQYVKELASVNKDHSDHNSFHSTECVTVDTTHITTNRMTISVPAEDASKETYRFSTFGFCENVQDVKPCGHAQTEDQTTSSFAHTMVNAHSSAADFSLTSAPLDASSCILYAQPHPVSKARNGRPQSQSKDSLQDYAEELTNTFQGQLQTLDNECISFHIPPNSHIYETITELKSPEMDSPLSELPGDVTSHDSSVFQQQSLQGQTAEEASADEQVSAGKEGVNQRVSSHSQASVSSCYLFSSPGDLSGNYCDNDETFADT